ncbi:hypothetical protein [Streptomyces sp. NPDC005374]|uniref:hypothetical protein n=1 Tax=Streptomyces sp. NPDC005374 TaxID=3364713 RepID=UPI0036BAB311
MIDARGPYYVKLKEGPDARGAIRVMCPAGGSCPSDNCAGHDRLHPPARTTMPARVIDLDTPRTRTAHAAARPTIHISDAERLTPPSPEALPLVCVAGSITVPADTEAADWRLAKYRQDVHYLDTSWLNTYKPIRSQNEGANGRFKGDKLDIGNPKHRPAPGQVAQALLLAAMLTVANLRILETWLLERAGPDELTDVDFNAAGLLPPLTTPAIAPPAATANGRHPPP